MEETLKTECILCGGNMISAGVQKIQLGEAAFFLGNLSNIFSGALEAEIMVCEDCRRMEFYSCEDIHRK